MFLVSDVIISLVQYCTLKRIQTAVQTLNICTINNSTLSRGNQCISVSTMNRFSNASRLLWRQSSKCVSIHDKNKGRWDSIISLSIWTYCIRTPTATPVCKSHYWSWYSRHMVPLLAVNTFEFPVLFTRGWLSKH